MMRARRYRHWGAFAAVLVVVSACGVAIPPSSVVRLDAEPAGANCAEGGVAIRSGLDDDRNGVLSEGEVASTEYICNGGDGVDGMDGMDGMDGTDGVAVRVSAAPWGGECVHGGTRVEVGRDDDGDGVLGDDEVDETQYACNPYFVQLAAGATALGTSSESGADATCSLVSDGSVRCWGANELGQLGDGTFQRQNTPSVVAGLAGFGAVAAIAAGDRSACALHTDGRVSCWGANAFGQLGVGAVTTYRGTPAAVVRLAGVVELDVGGIHACARLTDGTVHCWGDNRSGQLGDGTTLNSSAPVQVLGLADVTVVEVALGRVHSCARLIDNTVRCWGHNLLGGLGNGTGTDSAVPVPVSGLTDVAELALGYQHSCARGTDGSVRCWGDNSDGQVGVAITTPSRLLAPMGAALDSGAVALAAGGNKTCAVMGDGSAQCWGDNSFGQLAIDPGLFLGGATPTVVPALAGVAALTAGSYHVCALLVTGGAKCWGSNSTGQLGDGTVVTIRTTPTPVRFGF